ncbi:MAG TPA: Asp-tRNA(Asn)/Glu-tRNA(Gln) amidotransferase subunit GatB, partial [Chloroflexota bacterium]
MTAVTTDESGITEAELEPVIGLEIHAQLLTMSKMFCGCSAHYADAEPNTHVCAVCVGMPGALPVINSKAVEFTVMTARALHCRVDPTSKFDRKNYQYPDLPKGYQISQYDLPIGQDGWLDFAAGDATRRCGIVRVHLEEDTGKTSHTTVDGRDVSLVDYNRSGLPLMEIVSRPDLRSPEEAAEYFAALRQLLMYLGVSDGNLQEGSMRADVNVSVRRAGGELGTKVEIKNLNSFRAVQRALRFEIERQSRIIEASGQVEHETRGWSEERQITVSQRSKEYAQDYRYFPEPDLPALTFSEERVETIETSMPELPAERRDRLATEYGLSRDIATVITAERLRADFFERAARSASSVSATTVAHWLTGPIMGLLNESNLRVEDSLLQPEALGQLLTMVESGSVSGTAARTSVLPEMVRTGDPPDVIVTRLGLERIGDKAAIDALVDQVLAANDGMVAQYRAGKTQVLQ